ncbi:ATP-binding cassette domain-containing protein [Mesorhizobium sp. M4A.F.Ca.ET.022.05.2.1]|uniref:ABC transporter ATP-binding protein n=1 Tax=Mesorhizobium sp. M4A.F.Ca.ET.022.05.2.1 TaxID=2496653 RepID=UPI000FCAC6E1|nr:oligopeptide/dipeptide ABC transporter ATP-binding protein [Mesorhizobium sp. M4A.F.Ca.ET.022.05.2.1]RVC66988.1 ATP-binding cassette domain-containing protein [Mesorhizobium sp. M2A.F.Ca.ET.046.02.1.1]TIU42924.1 MAG: ATP-binding cassette domain-containing protein [Mesorhizobium sp.]RVC82526.1 ATP-binding cassette domain-containing protein [Mesorhizobium sp. M4A.F.Ca.ET.022.05.2.1]TIW60142.1 MAG: ATP-binding cassette domain-containing protein [Mesorhizobium sp.]TJW30905.1 MAG: ATP-binding ca
MSEPIIVTGKAQTDQDDILLRVSGLTLHFPTYRGVFGRQDGAIRALDGVNLEIRRGRTLGLVGESGCGKSSTGRAILRLCDITGGRIVFDGKDITHMQGNRLRRIRPRMQMIFQDTQACLNPRMTVGSIVAEPLNEHGMLKDREKEGRVHELLDSVGLNPNYANRYPHEFSGGQRQRIGIARAIALNPDFIVCDEPIAALDVSIQAQVVNLLKDLQAQFSLTYLFISHDLSMVRHMCDDVAVMYLGKVVELAPRDLIYKDPVHPYTKALLSAVPVLDPKVERTRQRIILRGDVPSPANPPSGCRFRTRCPVAFDRCAAEQPVWHKLAADRWVACHRAE